MENEVYTKGHGDPDTLQKGFPFCCVSQGILRILWDNVFVGHVRISSVFFFKLRFQCMCKFGIEN